MWHARAQKFALAQSVTQIEQRDRQAEMTDVTSERTRNGP